MARTPLRVLLMTHGFPPESVGGVEQHVQGLARGLVERGQQVEIFARSSAAGEQGSLHEGDWEGCTLTRAVYRWEGMTGLLDLYRTEVMEDALRRFLAGKSFDVAHVHHLTGLSTGCLDILREAGIPTLVTLHDYWIMCPRGQMWHREGEVCTTVEPNRCASCLAPTFPAWLGNDSGPAVLTRLHDLARVTLRSATRILTPSARTIPFYAALGVPPDSIAVVENGVDTIALANVPPTTTTGPLRVGYLGTLIPSKGLDVLVDAWRTLPPGTATLQVHGNSVPYHGDDGFFDRVFSGLPPDAAVTYEGAYVGSDLPRILGGIDVLVAPALWHEAFGLTVREAQAAGRPVVVSRIGGLQDAVTDGVEGLVVPPGDPVSLAAALGDLAGRRGDLDSMGAAGRARVRGFDEMTTDLLREYRDVCRP